MDFYLQQTATRGRRLADCTTGLSRLRGVSSSNALIESACEELVQRCGFHRAVISKLESRSWKPLVLHNREDNAATHSWFNEWVNKTVPLSQTAPEAEMVSRRRPSLVYDTDNAPVYRPLIVQAGQSRSYVVAPLVHGDDVIGFLHTDHHPLSRRVDEMDRDVLWAFTDGFTHIYERALLIEQLRAHRDSVRDLFSVRWNGSMSCSIPDLRSPASKTTPHRARVLRRWTAQQQDSGNSLSVRSRCSS
nr:GAF domain-containing protein [Mycolicibacterium sp. CBMA 360]